MALRKAVQCIVILLVIWNCLKYEGHREFLNGFFEELTSAEHSSIHLRQKREKRETSSNSTEYELQAVISISDLKHFQSILNTLSFPLSINTTGEITSINTTTVCSPNITANITGYQCTCEESFAWSYNKCINYGACDAIVGDTCGCINGLPADGQYCQLNTSQPGPVEFDIDFNLLFPISSLPQNFIDLFRDYVGNLSFPQTITQSLIIEDLNFTTWCNPNSTEGLQCQCEDQFGWSCDKCVLYGACSNVTSQTCGCIKGLPPGGEFCQPISSISPCPTPPPESVEFNIDLLLPISSLPPNFIDLFRDYVGNVSFPQNITQSLIIEDLNFTTWCYPNSTGGLQCQCEGQFAWSCDKCVLYSACSNVTSQTCGCIKGLPPGGEFCQPISTFNPCRPPTRTTTMTTTTPTMPNTTTPMPVTPTTTTTTTITTPTTTTTLTTTLIIQILEITMDVEFKEEYNQETNEFHKTVSKTITDEAASQGIKANLIQFRSGSTIAQYNVSAPSSITPDFRALNVKIFNKLAESYPMIFDASGTLMFSPTDGFYEQTVTVTCGPPPLDLNFGTVSAAEWRLNTVLIAEDGGHTISVKDGISTLTVSRFISSDDGEYECRLMRKKDKTFFRQKSATFSLKTKPTITVSPVREYVQCQGGIVPLKCSVSGGYQVEFQEYSEAGTGNSITYNYITPQGCQKQDKPFTCQSKTQPVFTKTITLQLSPEEAHCVDEKFGKGNEGFKAAVPCEPNQVGEITAVCKENRQFGDIEENCILLPVQKLLDESEFLTASTLPVFLEQLSNITVNFTGEVIKSPPNVKAIVRILTNVANKSSSLDISISNDSMENVLITAGVLTINGTTWNILNNNDTKNISNSTDAESVSSSFLDSLENITSHLDNTTFDIKTAYILLNRTRFTDTFSAELNSSVAIEIPEADGEIKTITTILFESLDNVLPARDEVNSSFNSINGRIVLVQSTGDINNISFTFDILNDTLGNPECVFWNFSLFNGLGGWDNEGCEVVLNINETGTVICNCNHLTSFSILMSPNSPKKLYLDIITYIGVGISMGSLVICLIIEGLIWRKIRKNETSYLRHVSIVNIAVSLLIANIWFIIGAAISDAEVKNPPACTAATFFIHFFYLALFFWMLASAMLLLYRTTNVFGGGLTKVSMLAIGFSLGYGAPLIIATVTIAATAPDNKYIRDNAVCWLNWDESKALLAFVIPALSIVVINLIILVVVLYKIIRRRVGTTAAQADERHVLLVIVKSLAVLTPFFGITWGLGAGILADPTNEGIHIAFAFFNSLQGFFILVFGTLLDSKVRSAIASYAQPSRSRTGSTSAGNSSSSGLQFLRNWRRGRDGYNMTSSASSDLHSASNT
ncbi:unnamed protein product [Oreochromis niloticus]|nr:unnamed protein product [Mustela putorius furo]